MTASIDFDDERNPSRVMIDRDLTLVGSGPRADVVIEDSNLSPIHCAIIHTRGGWRVLDLYSRQGTRVNDQLVADHILQTGDRIMLGKTSAVFEMTEDHPSAAGGEIRLEDRFGKRWPLESDSVLIGSWEGCDIVVEGAEPAHMIVVNAQGSAVVRATGTTGIVIVNGLQTDGRDLQDGDVLQAGEGRFTVRASHLPRRSDGEHVGRRVSSAEPTLCAITEKQERILHLLDTVSLVPNEIRQFREEIGRQLASLTQGMQSSADAIEEKVRRVSDREAEHTTQIQALGNHLAEHRGIVKGLMDRLARVVEAAESSRAATESAVGKLNAEKQCISTALDSRDKTLQKVWEGLIQVRQTMASRRPVSNADEAVAELREQVETLNLRIADLRSSLPQQLTDALKGFARTDQPGPAELGEQRARLAAQERRLAEEQKTLEETRRQVMSKGQVTLRDMAVAKHRHEQRKADLDQKEHVLAERELQLDRLRREAEQEHRRREQGLQGECQMLRTRKIEAEAREANSTPTLHKSVADSSCGWA